MKIMMIDDEKDCMESLTLALEPAGYKTEMFTSPADAITEYAQGQFDVVITDMRMPRMTGIQVLSIIRKLDPEARVIIMTGYGDAETAIAAVNNGAYAFFAKPVDIAELMKVLERVGKEKEQKELSQEEQRAMAQEYQRLKKAYEDMIKLLNSTRSKKIEG